MIKNFKTKLLFVAGIIIFLVSIILVCYPLVSSYIISKNQYDEIIRYNDSVKNLDDNDIKEQLEKARKYNQNLSENTTLIDPFNSKNNQEKDDGYEKLLSIGGSDAMASIEIPAIDIKLPIYHGTSDEVLQKGIGHLKGSSLPIGGKGTHAVLTGHSGLSSSKMFTDINQLSKGDVFYIHILNETLAYKVDQIKTVLPDEISDLTINPKEDYVSLVTCTPNGINSHRLLVRGTRIDYDDTQKIENSSNIKIQSNWFKEYKNAIITGVMIFIAIVIGYFIFRKLLKIRRNLK